MGYGQKGKTLLLLFPSSLFTLFTCSLLHLFTCSLLPCFRASLPLDVAADAGALVLGDGAAGQDGVDGGAEVFAGDGDAVAGAAQVELATVGEAQVLVEEVDIGCAGGIVGVGYLLGLVVEVGECKAKAGGLGAKPLGAVVGVGCGVVRADGDDMQGLSGVVGSELRNALFDVLDVRTVGAEEED